MIIIAGDRADVGPEQGVRWGDGREEGHWWEGHAGGRCGNVYISLIFKHLLPFSEYKIHTYDEIETILLENGLK